MSSERLVSAPDHTARANIRDCALALFADRGFDAVTAPNDGHSYVTSLRGFEPGTTLHGFRSTDGTYIELPTDGVLAGSNLASQLDISIGDTMRQTVTQIPGVVAYTDSKAFAATVDQYLGLFWAFAAMMIALGAVLALAIIYVTMAVNVVERTNELATLRAAGVPLRRVAGTAATQSLVATTLGIPFGLIAGVYAAKEFLATFSSDIFQFSLVLPWWVLPGSAVGVLLAAGISLWPASRAIARVDVAKVVRERSI